MPNIELLARVKELSRIEKFEMVQFLMTELARAESLQALDNVTTYRLWSPYDHNDAAQKLMSLLQNAKS
jgi:hypothetical protein